MALEARERGSGTWTLTVYTADAIGTLSMIAGLLTAEHLDIEAADLFTVRVPAPTGPPRARGTPRGSRGGTAGATVRRVLDVFEVRALPATGSAEGTDTDTAPDPRLRPQWRRGLRPQWRKRLSQPD